MENLYVPSPSPTSLLPIIMVKRIAARRQKLMADKNLYPQTIVRTQVFFRDTELMTL